MRRTKSTVEVSDGTVDPLIEATCVGCGCTEFEPCDVQDYTCHWIIVDRRYRVGVCSVCYGEPKKQKSAIAEYFKRTKEENVHGDRKRKNARR